MERAFDFDSRLFFSVFRFCFVFWLMLVLHFAVIKSVVWSVVSTREKRNFLHTNNNCLFTNNSKNFKSLYFRQHQHEKGSPRWAEKKFINFWQWFFSSLHSLDVFQASGRMSVGKMKMKCFFFYVAFDWKARKWKRRREKFIFQNVLSLVSFGLVFFHKTSQEEEKNEQSQKWMIFLFMED